MEFGQNHGVGEILALSLCPTGQGLLPLRSPHLRLRKACPSQPLSQLPGSQIKPNTLPYPNAQWTLLLPAEGIWTLKSFYSKAGTPGEMANADVTSALAAMHPLPPRLL